MHPILAVDWHDMLVPTVSLLELALRGSLVYLGILLGLRIFRREAGALSTADLLMIVLVADAAQNAMASHYDSITEGLVLIGTIFFWNYTLDWLGYRYPIMHRLLHPAPLELIRDGRLNRRNLRAEMLTLEDLNEQLREQGVEKVAEVKRCCLEADGRLSVIRAKQDEGNDGGGRRAEAGQGR
ncbi:MAG: YetF domain-containing protein [Gemmatimonadota bacterium]